MLTISRILRGSSPITSTDVVGNTTFSRDHFPWSGPVCHWHFPFEEDADVRIPAWRCMEACGSARAGKRMSPFLAGECPTRAARGRFPFRILERVMGHLRACLLY